MAAHVAKQAAARASRPAVSADVPILAAKITAPGVPDWAVPRPRITMLIAQGSRWHRLTVVIAPAGAGKTMALASWAAAEPGAVAWVGLDGYGNQPKIFWAHVVAALAAQDPPVTLVLDDLHLMTDPEVLDGLDYALRNVGPGPRLVVSGRMVPLPLHRYRLAGDLTEIRGRRSGVHHRRSRPAPGPARHHADRGLSRAPDPANRGLGGRPAPGRDLAAARQSAEPAQLELI